MNTKLNVQELFFQLKNKKQNRTKGFDNALFSLGIHHEIKTAIASVAKCVPENEVKVEG